MAPLCTRSPRVGFLSSGPRFRGASCSRRLCCRANKSGDSSVIDRPKTDVDISKLNSLLKRKPPLYRVLLHNDNSNRREYVVKTLLKVVDGLTVDDAVNIMQEAHLNGIGLVTVAAQETAEQYVSGLRRNGLTSTLEPQSGGSDKADS